MFSLDIEAWSIAARTVVVYAAILTALRLTGKRQLGQMTALDIVLLLLIANAVQNAMVGPDTSLTGGLLAAGVLIAAHYGMGWLQRRVRILKLTVEGVPTLLVNNGELMTAHLRKEGIDGGEVLMAMRAHGVEDLGGVRMAVLETDGSISIIPADAKLLRTRSNARLTQRGV